MPIRRGHRIGLIGGEWMHIGCAAGRTPPVTSWPPAA
jgi:hypothetical protein